MSTLPPRPRLGDRLSLRFDHPDGNAEVLGVLVGVDAEAVTVLPEGKPAVRVPRRAIRAARVVPPRPVRPVSPIEDVATIAAAGWRGAETERLGGWLLRAASGSSGRANSVLPTGEAGLPIEAAVEAVQAWYAERSLPARFTELTRLPELTPRFRRDPLDLRAELDRRGWDRVDTTLVLVGDLRRMPIAQDAAATAGRASTPRAASPVARWADAPDHAWRAVDGAGTVRWQEMELVEARYLTLVPADAPETTGAIEPPGATGASGATEPTEATEATGATGASWASAAGTDNSPVAAARLVVTRDWCGVGNLTVSPGHRGAGWGRAALAEALAEGRRSGARFAYLQVREDNEAARGLYAAAGFTPHHAYAYRNPA